MDYREEFANEIAVAIATLNKAGYFTDYLFHVDDVKCLTDQPLTDDEARGILEEYFEGYMSEINWRLEELVDYHTDKTDEVEDKNN